MLRLTTRSPLEPARLLSVAPGLSRSSPCFEQDLKISLIST